MANEFDDVMRSHTDAELIRILEGPPDDYQPSALESAKREFTKRNLSEGQIDTAKQEIVQKSAVDEAKANEPLPTIWKVLTFIFPGLIQIMFAGTFKADGYERKYRELVKWTLYGFFSYIGLGFLLTIINNLSRFF